MSGSTSGAPGIADGPWLRRYARAVGTVCQGALALAALLIIMDLILIGISVVLRYIFVAPISWGDEIVAVSLTAIVMLSAPEVLRRNGHIGVDVLTNLLPRRLAPWISLWSCAAVLSMAGLLVFNGWRTVRLSHMIGRLTEGHLELPVWALQLFLPLGGVLLAAVTIELAWRSLAQIIAGRPPAEQQP